MLFDIWVGTLNFNILNCKMKSVSSLFSYKDELNTSVTHRCDIVFDTYLLLKIHIFNLQVYLDFGTQKPFLASGLGLTYMKLQNFFLSQQVKEERVENSTVL